MLRLLLLVTTVAIAGTRAGNTTCRTTSLDWYTNSVGETPCRTYERLRQICNQQYQVGNFESIPPDRCNEQLSSCCCNSVAFSLSMLCLNCQQGVGSGANGDNGLDAGDGAYQIYLGTCRPLNNQSLPNATQAAVCRDGPAIPSYLYRLFWGTGDWFYEYTRQSAGLDIQSGNNGTRCAATSTSSSSTSQPTSSSPSSNSGSADSSSPNVGAIIGGVVGGIGLLLIAALVFWFSRRRRTKEDVDLVDEAQPEMTFEPYIDHPTAGQAGVGSSSSGPGSSVAASARPGKPGQYASGPTYRDEGGPSALAPPSSSGYLSDGDRHEDSAELTQALGLGRSASGRLPPGYQER